MCIRDRIHCTTQPSRQTSNFRFFFSWSFIYCKKEEFNTSRHPNETRFNARFSLGTTNCFHRHLPQAHLLAMSLNKIKQSCESPNLTTSDEWKHKTKLKYFQSLLHHYSSCHNNITESYHLRFRSWCFDCIVLVFIRWCGQLVNFVSKWLSVFFIGCEQYSSADHTGNNLLAEQCPVHRIPNHKQSLWYRWRTSMFIWEAWHTTKKGGINVASLHRIHKLALTNTSTKKTSATKKMHL